MIWQRYDNDMMMIWQRYDDAMMMMIRWAWVLAPPPRRADLNWHEPPTPQHSRPTPANTPNAIFCILHFVFLIFVFSILYFLCCTLYFLFNIVYFYPALFSILYFFLLEKYPLLNSTSHLATLPMQCSVLYNFAFFILMAKNQHFVFLGWLCSQYLYSLSSLPNCVFCISRHWRAS